MSAAFVVGLTGGIGSGKSTVANHLGKLGACVIDADSVSHALTSPGGAAVDAIAATFPGVVVNTVLDRALLRERVFASAADRGRLEGILHPMIRVEIDASLRSAEALAAPYVVLVVPLLFESDSYMNRIDCAVVVDVPEEMQVQRVVASRGVPPETVRRIMASQMPRAERLRRTQFVVDNSGAPSALIDRLSPLHQIFVANARHRDLHSGVRAA